jgi:hypothetical protein
MDRTARLPTTPPAIAPVWDVLDEVEAGVGVEESFALDDEPVPVGVLGDGASVALAADPEVVAAEPVVVAPALRGAPSMPGPGEYIRTDLGKSHPSHVYVWSFVTRRFE